jgi:ribonuclease-3 family protein
MNVNQFSSASLSYLGDSVLEVCVRRYLVCLGISHSAELNRIALEFVKANAQAEAVKIILPILTEDESAVFKRGRNARTGGIPKNASSADYHYATGLECLFGWLYLKGEIERINELYAKIRSSEEDTL